MTLEEFNSLIDDKYKHSACINESSVAKIIGVSAGTIAAYRNSAVGPRWISVGKGKRPRILYSKTAVLDFINSNEVRTM